jgi:hypothetical protein
MIAANGVTARFLGRSARPAAAGGESPSAAAHGKRG